MAPSSLTVPLKFLAWQDLYNHEKPFQIFIDIPPSAPDQRSSNLVFETVHVPLQDVRNLPDGGGGDTGKFFSLDGNGFVYRKHEMTGMLRDVGAFFAEADRETVERAYLPEVEKLLRGQIEGVDEVFFFDWRVGMSWTALLSICALLVFLFFADG